MSLPLFIYLAELASTLSKAFAAFSFFSGILLFFSIIGLYIETNENLIKKLKIGLKISIPTFILCTLISIAIPSKDTMYLMAGGYAAQEIATSEVGDKVKIIINQELDKLIENQK